MLQVAEKLAVTQIAVLLFGAIDIGLARAGVGRGAGLAHAGLADVALGARQAVVARRQVDAGHLRAQAGFRLAAQRQACGVVDALAQDDGFWVDLAQAHGLVAELRAVAQVVVVPRAAVGVRLAQLGVLAGDAEAARADVADGPHLAVDARFVVVVAVAARPAERAAVTGAWIAIVAVRLGPGLARAALARVEHRAIVAVGASRRIGQERAAGVRDATVVGARVAVVAHRGVARIGDGVAGVGGCFGHIGGRCLSTVGVPGVGGVAGIGGRVVGASFVRSIGSFRHISNFSHIGHFDIDRRNFPQPDVDVRLG